MAGTGRLEISFAPGGTAIWQSEGWCKEASEVIDATVHTLPRTVQAPPPIPNMPTQPAVSLQDPAPETRLAATSSLQAAVENMDVRNQQLESRLQSLESMAALMSDMQQPQRPQQPDPELVSALQALRSEVSQIHGEQSRLRSELAEFTNHTTTLISKLQTQIHQLFRMSDQRAQVASRPPAAVPDAPTNSTAPQQAPGVTHQFHDDASADAPRLTRAAHNLGPVLPASAAAPSPAPSAAASEAPQRLHISRNLFSDLPVASAGGGTGTASQQFHHPSAAVGVHIPVASIPVSNFEDSLALPSYSAMRRSSASITSFTPAARKPAPAVTTVGTATPAQGQPAGQPAGTQGGGRTMPGQFEHRALGSAPILSKGLAGAVAAAGGDLASLGIQLPNTKGGGAAVNITDFTMSGSNTGSGFDAFQGPVSTFGVLPEPLSFDQASDFKIVRVGGMQGTGLGSMLAASANPDNSLSLAAHTAAAMRQRTARGQ